jgi:hypothetical protein
MHIEESVRKSERLSVKEAKRLEKLFDEIVEANPSMPPEIYQPNATIEMMTNHGGQSLDTDVIGAEGLEKLKKFEAQDDLEGAEDILRDYMDGTRLESFEIKTGGWIAHLSMPGYLDQTEPTRYDTLKEAIEELHQQFADT